MQWGGKGILIQKDRIGALSTLNNQSVLDRKCLNPWDVQSKHIQPQDGKAESLYSGECRGGGGESYVLTTDKQPQAVCYGISGYESNAMKSSNPHSGIYEAATTRTLDLNGGNPACNQGGMMILDGFNLKDNEELSPTLTCQRVDTKNIPMVVEGFDAYNQALTGQKTMSITGAASDSHHIPSVVCLEGNGQRESHKGDGYKESDKMHMTNIAYPKKQPRSNKVAESMGGVRGIGDTVGALCRCDYKGVGSQYVSEGKCIVQNIGESSE